MRAKGAVRKVKRLERERRGAREARKGVTGRELKKEEGKEGRADQQLKYKYTLSLSELGGHIRGLGVRERPL